MRLIALISGGIDSPVASYMMDRIGADIVLLHMDNRPFADDESVQKVKEIAEQLRSITDHDLPLYSAPHGISQERISKSCDNNYQCVMCKRIMLRTAQEIAHKFDCKGIVMGDSLGQVASQTLKNIKAVSYGMTLPILRPLIGYDKIEIEAIAKEIGTYELSIRRSDGCSVIPSRPITEADLKKVHGFDASVDLERTIELATEGMIRLS